MTQDRHLHWTDRLGSGTGAPLGRYQYLLVAVAAVLTLLLTSVPVIR